jgi:SAM-dependent methyltransferase
LWWFAALHANLIALCRRFAPPAGPRGKLLDAGCGTGGLLRRLAEAMPETATAGIDADETACRWAMEKSGRPVCAGSVNALPFAEEAFTAIVSVDVLCHEGVDEAAALGEFRRCLAAGGVLILNLPAYRWLMSGHDRAVYNVRRYTRGEVALLLRRTGFHPVFTGYWNMILFPLMVATRKLLPAGTGSDVKLAPAWIEALCRAATHVERKLLAAGFRCPFGGSVLAVARKTGNAHG